MVTQQQQQGCLERWNDDKGFGFIQSADYRKGVFIHISAFKRNISRRPMVGDIIIYQLDTDYEGKVRAVNASIQGVSLVAENSKKNHNSVPRKNQNYERRNHYNKKSSPLFAIVSLTVTIIFFFAIANFTTVYQAKQTTLSLENRYSTSPITSTQKQYSCQGKTYCSEMSSCEEATFYQNNCSGTKMDGDGDGVPCEDMCGH